MSLALAGIGVQAQNYNQYESLKNEGAIPDEFIMTSTKKYQASLGELSNDKNKKTAKDKKAFLLESNFEIDDLLHSGLVLFNDPITIYLNEVAQKLATTNEKLKNVRVYALRSTAVNAFATDRGNVFVSLGLLAQLEDEAQLAFILSHELTHVEEGHNIQLFLKNKEISRKLERSKVLRETTYDESSLTKHNYSKELETEADDKGFQRLVQQTKYSTKTLQTVFDVLKYSYLPFDEVVFEKSFFEDVNYVLPKSYYLDKVVAINGEDEADDDSQSSHPNIAKRRAAFQTAVKNVDETGRSIYLVSEERFKNLRQVARYELCMIYLHNDHCRNAIYASHILLKANPESIYLKKIIAKALYILAKYRNQDGYESNEDSYKRAEGEFQRVAHLIYILPAKDLSILALRYNYKLWKANPNDLELERTTKDLFVEMAKYFSNLNEFKNISLDKAAIKAEIDAIDSTKSSSLSKYDKIKKQQGQVDTTGVTSNDYWQYAFVGDLADTLFTKNFEKGLAEYKKREERRTYYKSPEGRKAYKKELRQDKKKGVALDINKIVVVNPFYIRLDTRKEVKVDYLASGEGKDKLIGILDESAKASGIDYQILDVNSLKSDETDKFNDISMLNDWFAEQMNHDNFNLTPGYKQEQINAIAKKYGTDYFLWTGVASLRVKSMFHVGYLFPTLLPYAIYTWYKRKNETLIYSVLYDVRTGRNQVINYSYIKRPTRDAILKSQFYDTFLQIKRSSIKGKK